MAIWRLLNSNSIPNGTWAIQNAQMWMFVWTDTFQNPLFSSGYRPQRSWGKVMFLQVCVILFTGRDYLTRYTPRPGTPPTGPGTPPRPGTPPGPGPPPQPGTPQDHVHPPDQVHPLDQVHTPLQDQAHPPDQVHPPTRYTPQPGTPPRPGTPPQDQVHPLGSGTPSPLQTRYTPRVNSNFFFKFFFFKIFFPEFLLKIFFQNYFSIFNQLFYHPPPSWTREIQSTRGRYASYWNAFLFQQVCGRGDDYWQKTLSVHI